MPAPVPIRADRSPAELRRLARRERDGRIRSLTRFPWLPSSVTTS